MSGRMKRVAANVALSLVSVAVVLGLLEGVARIVLRNRGGGKEEQTTGTYTEFDPVLGWRKIPGSRATFHRREYTVDVEINSRALRGPERAYAAAPGTLRLLSLGDYFVEGQGVSVGETATALVESTLGAPGCPVEGLNGGTIGYSTDQEYLFYLHEGSQYRPQVVLLFLYYNDVVFNTSASYYGRPKPLLTAEGGRVEMGTPPAAPRARKREAVDPPDPPSPERGSVLYGWVADRLQHGAPGVYDSLAGFGLWPKTRVVSAKREMFVYRKDVPRFVDEAWAATAAILGALRARVEADGGHLAVVYVPSRMEVSDRDWELTRRLYGFDEDRWDRGLASRRVAAIGDASGLPVLDLTAALRREERGVLGSPYYVYDGHWNPKGHRIAAQQIAGFLKARGWLPACAAARVS